MTDANEIARAVIQEAERLMVKHGVNLLAFEIDRCTLYRMSRVEDIVRYVLRESTPVSRMTLLGVSVFEGIVPPGELRAITRENVVGYPECPVSYIDVNGKLVRADELLRMYHQVRGENEALCRMLAEKNAPPDKTTK